MWWQLAGTLGSTALQSYMADRAADRASDVQQAQYDQTRADFAPWRAAGQDALGQLMQGVGQQPTAEEVMNTPGYQFGLQQGQQAIDRQIARGGGRISGAAIKAAGRFGTDYATSGYNAAYQRGQDRLNRLAAIAGLGQTATGASAAAGANSANAISGLVAGNNLAQGSLWGNAINQGAAIYGRNQGNQGGSIWQGGAMDRNAYSDYGYTGGP